MTESVLVSHRDLFQSVFEKLSGVIVHLGNKELEEENYAFWFAGMLMDWQHDEALVFLPEPRQEVADLMRRLISLSPQKRIIFASDYQFGGARHEYGEVCLSEFLRLHDQGELRYNCLWYISAES